MRITLSTPYSFLSLGGRRNQEDSRYPNADEVGPSEHHCFLVCDGVGGAAKGEVASATVAETLGREGDRLNPAGPINEKDLSAVVYAGYKALNRASDPSNEGMATTMTMLLFSSGGVWAAHIGDSRIYQIRPGMGILYRSDDHSLVNALVRTGNISPEEAVGHPQSNVITRCMTPTVPSRNPDNASAVLLTDVRPGDVFILASDGVLRCVSDEELERVVSSMTDYSAMRDRLRELSAGSSDNNTLWLIPVADVTETKEEIPTANVVGCDTAIMDCPMNQVVEIPPLPKREPYPECVYAGPTPAPYEWEFHEEEEEPEEEKGSWLQRMFRKLRR